MLPNEWANERRLVAFRSFPRRTGSPPANVQPTEQHPNPQTQSLQGLPRSLHPNSFWCDIQLGSILADFSLCSALSPSTLFATSSPSTVALYTPFKRYGTSLVDS
ncbi:hypothetical protein N7G274_000476 [Stereocaulon virgatum]|uniref:Uncharacterized protein n=1 Tax=Stereocaulon virgatum TaxID=373712 RepID=A0ABR4ASQ2_9LECA